MVATLLLLLAVGAVAAYTRDPFELALAAFGALLYVFPLVVGAQVNQVRSHALILPAAVVLRRLPGPFAAAAAVCAVPVTYWLTTIFVSGALV
jgi:hypothetical protein